MSWYNPFSFSLSRLATALKLAKRAFGAYKKQAVILSILGVLSGLLQAVGANALIPLFSFFVNGTDRIGTDSVTNFIRSMFAIAHIPLTLPSLLVFICLMFTGSAGLTCYFNYIRNLIRTGYQRATMDQLYRETLSADWPYLSKQKLGHLETVIMTDVSQSGVLLDTITSSVGMIGSFLMYLVVAMNISKTVTVMTLVLGGAVFLVFKPFIFKVRRYSIETEALNKEISHQINESIGGVKSIKAAGNEKPFIDFSSRNFEALRRLQMRTVMIQSATLPFIQPIGIVFISAVVAFAYYRTAYNLGALAAIIYLIQKMFDYIQSLQQYAQNISGAVPFVQGVLEYRDQAARFAEPLNGAAGASFSFKKELRFDGVSFAYAEEQQIEKKQAEANGTEAGKGLEEKILGDHVLKGLSFAVPKGNTIGIIGKSGAGKTTVFDLILRLLKPSSGSITIDGKDINDINLSHWRHSIAYVPQDAFLLNDTIRNNIRFHDQNVSNTDVENAVETAYLKDFVSELPEKLETVVGERGVRLSGGQRQRIAIARALARKPEILLLDEATSALDGESEKYIQQAIESLKGKMTIVIIAHRLSTVAHSDSLLVLDAGKIVESGKPADLLKDKETYYSKMYDIRN